jgi:hypothetical protein
MRGAGASTGPSQLPPSRRHLVSCGPNGKRASSERRTAQEVAWVGGEREKRAAGARRRLSAWSVAAARTPPTPASLTARPGSKHGSQAFTHVVPMVSSDRRRCLCGRRGPKVLADCGAHRRRRKEGRARARPPFAGARAPRGQRVWPPALAQRGGGGGRRRGKEGVVVERGGGGGEGGESGEEKASACEGAPAVSTPAGAGGRRRQGEEGAVRRGGAAAGRVAAPCAGAVV